MNETTLTQLTAIILAVAALLPLLTSVVQQPRWTGRTRTIIAVVVSVVAGLVTYVTTNGVNLDTPSNLVVCIVGVVIAAAAAYKTIWQPLGTAPAIENATSPTSPEFDDLAVPAGDPDQRPI